VALVDPDPTLCRARLVEEVVGRGAHEQGGPARRLTRCLQLAGGIPKEEIH
jgi:hypothetical protein